MASQAGLESMQTLALGQARRRRVIEAGFTLIELMVVLVIAGILVGAAALSALPNEAARVRQDAYRLSFLLQIARDEAIVRNRLIAFEAGTASYRFLQRENNTCALISDHALLRERPFCCDGMLLSMMPTISGADRSAAPVRIVFGREPVSEAFLLTLQSDKESAQIRADGLGNFSLQ